MTDVKSDGFQTALVLQINYFGPFQYEYCYKQFIFNIFFRFYYKGSSVRPKCDVACKKRILCDLHSGRSHDRRNLCEDIESRIDATVNSTWKQWFYNTLSVS